MTAPAGSASDPAFRRTYIGGSDAAAVAGVGRWGSPYSVWLEKVGQSPERAEPSERMMIGSLLEDVVGREWARRNRVEILEAGPFYRHPAFEYVAGHLDFLGQHPVDGRIVLEVKVSDRVTDWEDGNGDPVVPVQYYLQVQHYLLCTQLFVGYIAVLLRGSEIRTLRIPADTEVQVGLLETYADFWRMVQEETPPEPDGHEATANAIKARYPASEDSEMVGGVAESLLAESLIEARGEVAEAQARHDAIANRIKDRMGTTERLLTPAAKITWKSNRPSEKTDWQSVARAYRMLIEEAYARDAPGIASILTEEMQLATLDALDTIESIHTNTIPGARVFRVTPSREE